ncbi:MAG: DUF4823 domain-containing protein [Gammaproteobacteria bacterium]|nr:DUF4823 domain-containing protein [Gammaproteobacteria bacterium]
MLKFPLLAICIAPLLSCTGMQALYNDGVAFSDHIGLTSDHQVERNAHWVLSQDTSFYVAMSGINELIALTVPTALPATVDTNPPDQVSDLLMSEIGLRFPRVMRAGEVESIFSARQSAASSGLDYVVYPRLLLWEDTAGTWSEIADTLRYTDSPALLDGFGLDRARLQLTLLEVNSGRIMDVVAIDSRGGLLALYQENPQRLLASALGRYVDSLVP